MAAASTSSDDHGRIVLDLDVGDSIELATSLEAYDSVFDVVDTDPVTQWRVPFASDWETRELELQGRGTTWYLTYDGFESRLYSAKRNRTRRGEPITELTRVSDADADEVWCGYCGEGPMTPHGGAIHSGHCHALKDRNLLEEPPEFDASIPGELTAGDIAAVADHYDTISEAASDLEVSEGRARAILADQDCLTDIDPGSNS